MRLSECKNLMLVCSLLLVVKSNASSDEVQFNRDIRPILANHCFACHGPDAAPREAELRLDLEAAAKADRDPQVIVAHDAKASELVNRISTADHDLVMPPVEFDKPLSVKQKILLTQWIVLVIVAFTATQRQSEPCSGCRPHSIGSIFS